MGSRVISKSLIELGERIRKRRQELRWSQEKLAEAAEVSLNTVSRAEGGQSDMSIAVFRRLTQALGMSASELLGDVNPGSDGLMPYLLYRLQLLEEEEQEVVVHTMTAMMDAFFCSRKKNSHDAGNGFSNL